MKKRFLSVAAVLAPMMFASTSHAIVVLVADCTTSSGYHIRVVNNQGTGLDRHGVLGAQISDSADNQITGFKIDTKREGSISFGRVHYTDSETGGQIFDLARPSTNEGNSILKFTLPDGSVIADDQPSCRY